MDGNSSEYGNDSCPLEDMKETASAVIDVLGGEEHAMAWLRHPNGALGGALPLHCLSTDLGAKRVEAILSHIE